MANQPQLYKPGQSGNPAGRPKGIRNHIKFEVAEIMQRVDCNPFEILAEIAKNGRSEKVRCEAASELASYLAPKLKAVELTQDPTNPILFQIITKSKNNADNHVQND